MSAVRSEIPQPKRLKHIITCCVEGCDATQTGYGSTEVKARHDANRQALDNSWDLMSKNVWRCGKCRADFIRGDSQRRILLRADAKKAEQRRIKEAKREAAARRATRPVGDTVAKADTTLTKDTHRLKFGSEFKRLVYPNLDATQRRAADEFAQEVEKESGVSDREAYSERVDSSVKHYDPTPAQMDAAERLRRAKAAIHSEMYAVLTIAIVHDGTPREVGSRYKWTNNERDRGLIGMSMIRVALNMLADHWGLSPRDR